MTDVTMSHVLPKDEGTALRAIGRKRALPALAVLLLAIGILFAETFHSMERIWARSDTFAHAYVVLPISLWLIWRQRASLPLQPVAPSAWLLVPFSLLALLWLPGQLMSANVVMQFAATGLLALALPMVLGVRLGRVILFPLAFLFFAVPFGDFTIPWLMQWTADFTVTALQFSGVPVYREGMQFVIPSGQWSVVEECSGVRYLMASFMVGSLFAYLNYRTWQRRLVFGVVSLVMPVLANWIRAYLIVMAGHFSGNKIATGADHLIYGWVFFGIVITAMFMIGARWSQGPAEPAPPASVKFDLPTWRPWTVALAGLVMIAVPHIALQVIVSGTPTGAPSLAAISLATGWRLDGSARNLWKPRFTNPDAESVSRVESATGGDVGLYLAYYRRQGDGHKLVSFDNQIVTSQDKAWNLVSSHEVRTVTLGNGQKLEVSESIVRPGVSRDVLELEPKVVWQFYWVGGVLTRSDPHAKLLTLWHRLVGQGDDSAAVVVYASDTATSPAGARLEQFLRENLPAIERSLAQTREQR